MPVPALERQTSQSEKAFMRKNDFNYTEHKERFVNELTKCFNSLQCYDDAEGPLLPTDPEFFKKAIDRLAEIWKLKDNQSEIAFDGLMLVMEMCLAFEMQNSELFAQFIAALNFHTVFFWRKAVPIIFDSDMRFGNGYRDALLFSLSLHDVNQGQNRLRELYAAVPGLRNSLLGKHAKKFEERFRHLIRRRSAASLSALSQSQNSLALNGDVHDELASLAEGDETDQEGALVVNLPDGASPNGASPNGIAYLRQRSVGTPSQSDGIGSNPKDIDDELVGGGLVNTSHCKERVINVSNAPPVALKQDVTGEWSINQGSGGLVACVDPVMSQDVNNVWLANLGPDITFDIKSNSSSQHKIPDAPELHSDLKSEGGNSSTMEHHHTLPTTNNLGIPIIKKAELEVQLKVLSDPTVMDEGAGEDDQHKQIREQMSLVGVLRNYNKSNYKLNPVEVHKEDYNVYYGGISNGLFWPAFHNLPEYIVNDYDDPEVLKSHWHSYVRVNYQFAINAVRNSRSQDFIWIHDYHLIVTGMIMQSLDPNLEVGFFLHIPFQLPDEFFTKYHTVALAVLRGLLRFTKVGFQTHLDRQSFIELVQKHLFGAKIVYDHKVDIHSVTYDGWTCSLGVFPVSIKNEEYLDIANDPLIKLQAIKLKEEIKSTCLDGDDGKFFFSVERFDYTKGIGEKLKGYQRYFEKHPDRIGKDVLKQVAVINRRSVDTYRVYQDECMGLVELINATFKCPEKPEWKPIIFQTDGLARRDLVAHYLAMDIGLVAPKKDGMNLVAKEMVICNENSLLMISTGAGTEQQLRSANFYTDEEQCYFRIEDIYDPESYADVFFRAASADLKDMFPKVKKVREFLMANDIEKWSAAFLDPGWTHQVIRPTEVKTLDQFYNLMIRTAEVRRKIVNCVIKGVPIKNHYNVSLSNALDSLRNSCSQEADSEPNKLTLCCQSVDRSRQVSIGVSAQGRRRRAGVHDESPRITFDISDEISEFENDLAFLEYVQSESVDNIEQFLHTLERTHPVSIECYHEEVGELVTLMERADHFQYFFTDRDGTLKSYSCSYPSSVQPAYAGVIQATFARRCAQVCAMITSAPLMHIGILDVHTMPEGCFFYGASGGREWFITSARKFKDSTINPEHLVLLDTLFEKLNLLLDYPQNRQFRWLGSGLQKHYGLITVAKQDIHSSVDSTESATWYHAVSDLVNELDPVGQTLHCHETGTDIKITVKQGLGSKMFSKGQGIQLLCAEMKLDLTDGNILVCGDTETDLSMLEECLMKNPANTFTIWVSRDKELQDKVIELCTNFNNTNYAFVSCPAVLLGAMAQATIRRIKIHHSDDEMSDVE